MADEEKLQRYLRKATAELRQARGRLAAEEAKNHEPVAIIGIGCRFPGGVRSPEDLWRLVDGGEDALSGLPENRGWNLAGSLPGLQGGFLHDADEFDAEFFGMEAAEALATDPQQRLLLETAWEAFERAGIDPTSAKETRTAVYAGLQFAGYPLLLREPPGPDIQDYLGFGNSVGAGSGRVAYLMGLLGAAVTVDTQCTSSLVAVHLACKALRNGECTLALAGGAAVMSLPTTLLEFRRTGKLSPDGRSRSFAAAADGVSLSEGAGMLLLERLSDARRNGHPVLAVVRGSAINQDGATNGMSAPRGQAQERVIRQALADARLSAESVDVVEGHGVGATLGDGVEASSVITVYGSEHSPEHPVLLGSVKSNIGHTQTVGAIAGITKLVMALRHERVPATLHVDAPTPHADWSSGTVELATEACPWPAGDRVRRAAVSCLTLSGTNAHLVLEEPPAEESAEPAPSPAAPVAWPLSARTPAALRELAARLREAVGDADPRDTAAALVRGRPAFRHRAVVVGGDREELLASLDALAAGHTDAGAVQGAADPRGHAALLFGGGSPARPGGALGLYTAFPLFARALDEVCERLDGSVRAALLDAARPYASPAASRLAGFALQVALHRLLTAFGAAPRQVAGFGLGEVAAAHAAGALGLDDACVLATALAREADGEPCAGLASVASVSVRAGEDELREQTEVAGGDIVVAAMDEPDATVLTGPTDAIAALTERLRAQGRGVRALEQTHVVRTVDPAALRSAVAELSAAEPNVPLVSGSDGQAVTARKLADAQFWAGRLTQPSRLVDAVRLLLARGVSRFVDLDPRAALAPLVARAAAGQGEPGRTLLPVSLLTGSDEPDDGPRALLSALAALYADGVTVDWEPALEGHTARRVDLPTYPFQRRRHWLVPPDGAAPQPLPGAAAHPLLGAPIELAGTGERRFGGRVADGTPAGAALPRVHGTALLSPAALVDWALAAARHGRAPQDAPRTLREVRLHAVPELPADAPLVLQTVGEEEEGGERVRGFVRAGAGWQPSFTARVGGPDAERADDRDRPEESDPEQWHRRLWRLGVPQEQAAGRVTALYTGPGRAEAVVEHTATAAGPWHLPPALLETVLRIAALAAEDDPAPVLRTVASIDRITVHGSLPAASRVTAQRRPEGSVTLEVTSEQGEPLLVAEGLRLRPAEDEQSPTAAVGLMAHELHWQPLAGALRTAVPGARDGSWLIHSADTAAAEQWREQLALAGVPAFVLAAATQPDGADDGVLPLDAAAEDAFEQVRKELAERGTTVAGLLLHDETTAVSQVVRGFLRACATERPAFVLCSGTTDPQAGLVPALARTTAWEHPELPCVSVELTAAEPLPDAAELLGRAAQLAGSGRLSWRGGRWYEARLRTRPLDVGAAGPAIRGDAAYLVVGDGPEALAAADWLTARGAGSVARVADDPAEVASALSAGPAVRGVVRLASETPERALADWDGAGFEQALEQATAVPRLLDEQAGDLDFLLLCSPLATLPGRAGAAVATAAAEYADALAFRRRTASTAALSVACGPWQGAAGGGVAELAASGLHPIPVGRLLDAVWAVPDLSGASAAVGRADWGRYRAAAERAVPYVPLEGSSTDTDTRTVGFGQGNMNTN
ncbi:polyketide synthase [Streptomyces sp. P17]|uniref:polyketide synthase n=1 Tax=Streptomyces sp. P17 TaxID=3074716 RepID=UPI0028F4437E|nr:polyketide synthase [Streptomyces sp. P17]MDT9701304.1 beta-ketoacyl synthase N-terminal-like domain-containing protein [Streptomyces sp. P17]